MEKIYMENSKKKKRSFQSSTSIMMSFILAFVAIVSIVAYGYGQISFAIPEESETPFPATIETANEDDQAYSIIGPDQTKQIHLHRALVNGETRYVYCVESAVPIAGGTGYSKGEVVTDKGLLFLLHYLSDDYKIVYNDGTENKEVNPKVKAWIAQTVIWSYLFDIKAPNNGESEVLDAEKVAYFKTVKYLRTVTDFGTNLINLDTPIYDACKINGSNLSATDATITGLLAKAKAIHANPDSWNVFTINISKKSDNISLTSDEKYYQSDVITVNGTTGFKGYKINVDKLPEGSKIFDTNGNELTGDKLDNLVDGTQFIVRVPVDKITEENKVVGLEVEGAFEGSTAYTYVATDKQTIAYPGKVVKRVKQGIDLKFEYTPEVPDTSITAAQSIYFIGLIILLAGVGIIYANIKPNKAVQQ